MRVGVQLYPWARWPDIAGVAEVTRAAEKLGFDNVVLSEHLVTPLTGDEPPSIGRTWPEIHVVWPFRAGSTETIRLVSYATVEAQQTAARG